MTGRYLDEAGLAQVLEAINRRISSLVADVLGIDNENANILNLIKEISDADTSTGIISKLSEILTRLDAAESSITNITNITDPHTGLSSDEINAILTNVFGA